MSTLFVLGNGFDLQHGLPTMYDPHLKTIAMKAERFPGEWESYSIGGNLWSDVEERLAHPDIDLVLDHLSQYNPDLGSDREGDRDAIIHEAEQLLTLPLDEFARRADENLDYTVPLQKFGGLFQSGDRFLTFNYTHTLEYLYRVDPLRILHLHGESGVSRLILGYAPGTLQGTRILRQYDDEENFDFYRSRAYGAVARRMNDFEKVYQHERLVDFIGAITQPLRRILVYGHSFGAVDMPYFEYLARTFKDIPWTVCAYNDVALEDACQAFDGYGLGIAFERNVL